MANSPVSSAVLLFGLLCISSLTLPGAAAAFYDIREYAEVFSPLGPRQNTSPTQLGQIFAYNNDLREGDTQGATIGFVNGNCVVSEEISNGVSNTGFECSETLVFRNGTYAGSSITVVGYYDFVENGPLAIVGGTGLFRGATGELNYVVPPNNPGYSVPTLVFLTPDFPSTATKPTTCSPGSDTPNQCFSADGSSFVCCAGACGPSGTSATCA